MKSVLCAGSEGFLGSHVCEYFIKKGWHVVGYDNRSKMELLRTGYNVELARDYNKNYLQKLGVLLQKADIRNIDTLRECAKHVDYIINCAAQPAMTIALEEPTFDCDNNVVGTLNILQVARELNIPCAICSTIHCYGNGINKHLVEKPDRFYHYPTCINESHELLTGQVTPLHISKYTTELYARAFIESYGCRVFVARLTGIAGRRSFGGEDHSWMMNFAIRTIMDYPIRIFGSYKQVRDMVFAGDVAESFYLWYERGQKHCGVYNICGGEKNIVTLYQCLKRLSEITNKKQSISIDPPRLGDLWYFVGDYSKAENDFGWKPKTTIEDILQDITQWVSDNRELFKG